METLSQKRKQIDKPKTSKHQQKTHITLFNIIIIQSTRSINVKMDVIQYKYNRLIQKNSPISRMNL